MQGFNGVPRSRLTVDISIDYHTILGEAAMELCQRIPSAYAMLMARTLPPWVLITNTAGGCTRVGEIRCEGQLMTARISGIAPQAIAKNWPIASVDMAKVIRFVAKYLR